MQVVRLEITLRDENGEATTTTESCESDSESHLIEWLSRFVDHDVRVIHAHSLAGYHQIERDNGREA